MQLAKVTISEGVHAAAGQRADKPNLAIVAPIVEAAARVLKQMCGQTVTKGTIHRIRSSQPSAEVSALIAVTGGIAGIVIYSMTRETAMGIASEMMGERVTELDSIAQSAIAELANIITGQAGISLQKAGIPNDMSPPMLLIGGGAQFATFNLTRLVVPLVLSTGEFNIDMGIKET